MHNFQQHDGVKTIITHTLKRENGKKKKNYYLVLVFF